MGSPVSVQLLSSKLPTLQTRKMKMLVSLIAVCLMVAAEAYSHKECVPHGYPMNDRFYEPHVMHRYPSMIRDSQMYRDLQMYRDPHFYRPAFPSSYYRGPFYDRHHYD